MLFINERKEVENNIETSTLTTFLAFEKYEKLLKLDIFCMGVHTDV